MKKTVTLEGIVVHGKGIGKTVGMPTANIECDIEKLKVDIGVYASIVYIDKEADRETGIKKEKKKDKFYVGVTNIGTRPSVDSDNTITIETNIIDFDEDIYGKYIRVELVERIRDIVKFNNLIEVKEQVDKDKKKAVKIIKGGKSA